MKTAYATIKGFEVMRMLKKGQMLVLSQIFSRAQNEDILGDFMPRVHRTVQRWTDFLS